MSQPYAEKLPKYFKNAWLCIRFISPDLFGNVYDSMKTPLAQDIFRHILFTANQYPSKKNNMYRRQWHIFPLKFILIPEYLLLMCILQNV